MNNTVVRIVFSFQHDKYGDVEVYHVKAFFSVCIYTQYLICLDR